MPSPAVRTQGDVHLPDENEHGRTPEESNAKDQINELSKAMNAEVDGVDSGTIRMDGGPKSGTTLEPVKCNDTGDAVCCKTCDSTQECEEDVDNPGDYYCKCCWEEYAIVLSQQQQVREAGRVNGKDSICSNVASDQSLHIESETAHSLTTQTQSEYQIESSQQLHTQTLTPLDDQRSQSPRKMDSQQELRGERNDSTPATSHVLLSSRNDACSAKETSNKNVLLADRDVLTHVDTSKCNLVAYERDDSQDKETSAIRAAVENAVNPDETTCYSENNVIEPEIVDVETGSIGELKDGSIKNEKAEAIVNVKNGSSFNEYDEMPGIDVVGDAHTGSDNIKYGHEIEAIPPDTVPVVDESKDKNTNDKNDKCQNYSGRDPNKVKEDILAVIEEPVDKGAEIKTAAFDEDNDHDNNDEQDDQDLSLGTQEMVDPFKVNGLLTQAGSLSGDDDNNTDAMNEDVKEKDEDVIACHSTVEHGGAPDSANNLGDTKDHRLPTIETSKQVVISALTSPSQNPCLSIRQSIEDEDQVALKVIPSTKEATTNRVDCPDSPIDGETQDIYGAETQILPSSTLQPSANEMQEASIAQPQQIDLNDKLVYEDAGNRVSVRSCKGTGHEAEDVTGHVHSHPSEDVIEGYDEMKLTPEKGLLSSVSYPKDHLENKPEVNAPVTSDDVNYHLSCDDHPGSQHKLSQDLLEEPSMRGKVMEELDGIVASKPPTSRVSHLSGRRKDGEQHATEWLSSRDKIRSPRLILPPLKPDKDKESDKSHFAKDIAEKDSFDADESDDSSMFECHAHPHENDSLEDTQTQDKYLEKKTSNFKRLSRGTHLNSSRGKAPSPKSFSTRALNSSLGHKRGGHNESKSVITPKVLRYPKANHEHIESHSEWEDDGGSCGEITKKRYREEQSQTNHRAMKQLEEIKEFTKHLPSAEELNKLADRKQLLDEIAQLNRSHFEEITELKRELCRLQQVIRQKDEVINEMNREIREKDEKTNSSLKEKNDIIKKQSRAMNELMTRLGAISLPVSADREEQRSTKDATHQDSDDGSVVLPALKRPGKRATSRENEADTRQQSVSKKMDAHSLPFSSEMWKVLQEKGWKYKTGPEPYNKVYVPPDGATHAGTLLGIHFFHGEQVVDAAIERGHINENCDSSHSLSELAENEWSDSLPVGESGGQIPDTPVDDAKLLGHSKLITPETARISIELAASFMEMDQESVSFKGFLFNPLWQILKVQGAESNLNWSYEKCKTSSLSRNWCFVPPSSQMGSRGERGVDFYVTEEEVVYGVLQEAITFTSLSTLFSKHSTLISALMQILSRAVKNNMEYKDALEGKSPKTRTRRQAVALLDALEQQTSSSKKRLKSVSPKNETPIAEKRKTPSSTSLSDTSRSTGKKTKIGSNNLAAFHSSQTQGNEAVTPSVNRNNPSGPLSKYKFFFSGIDKAHSIDSRIRKLGGQLITIDKDTSEKAHGTIFFLSDYTFWRRPKYIFAAALGVPMLHYEWLTDLEQKFRQGGNAKAMSSDLYQKHRLPIGLDHSTGVYILQRASHARDWLRPGFIGRDEGEPIFNGMTIAIAVDPATESEWQAILSALGASAITLSGSKLKGKGLINGVDCCLLSSAMLPPQATSTPIHVSEMIRRIPDGVPLLDLAWAHQSIIQRKCLPLHGDPRYEVHLDENALEFSRTIYSIKSKSRRYEVGDLVQFSNSSKTTSFGRILSIRWAKQGSHLEVQLLEKRGEFELIDCSSSAKLNIQEHCLDGSIVMLGSKDIRNLGYASKSSLGNSIFRQVKPFHDSQL